MWFVMQGQVGVEALGWVMPSSVHIWAAEKDWKAHEEEKSESSLAGRSLQRARREVFLEGTRPSQGKTMLETLRSLFIPFCGCYTGIFLRNFGMGWNTLQDINLLYLCSSPSFLVGTLALMWLSQGFFYAFSLWALPMERKSLVSNHHLCATQRLCGICMRLFFQMLVAPGLPPPAQPRKAFTGWSS